MEECPICSGRLREAKVTVEISGIELGSFDGLRCDKCGEQLLLPESMNLAHALALNKNLFGILKTPEPIATAPHVLLSYELQTTSSAATPLSSTSEMSLTRSEVEISTTQTGSRIESIRQR